MPKFVDRETGKVFDVPDSNTGQTELSNPGGFKTPKGSFPILERLGKVEAGIEERGSLPQKAMENIKSPNLLRKVMGAVQFAGVPFQAFESSIANPLLAIQKGEKDVGNLIGEAMQGANLEKQGELGDILRVAGFPEPAAATMGFTASIAAPTKVLMGISKSMHRLSRGTDKQIMKAGEQLIQATQNARKTSGEALDKAFSKVDTAPVNGEKLLDAISDLPSNVVKELEKKFGDLFSELTLRKVRKIKQEIGSLRPSAFGKDARGVAERIDDRAVNRAYAKMKGLIEETATQTSGKRSAKALMDAEESFSEIMDASKSIRRSVMDPTLRKPTKGGAVASKLAKEGDVTTRTALKTLRDSGPKAKKDIDRAVDALNAFNRHMQTLRVLGHVGSAVAFGGALGAVGGRLVSKGVDR